MPKTWGVRRAPHVPKEGISVTEVKAAFSEEMVSKDPGEYVRTDLCHPPYARGYGGAERPRWLPRTLGPRQYRECETLLFSPRPPDWRKAARARCRRRLMFIHAAFNSLFEYKLIKRFNCLLKSRQLGLEKSKEASVRGKAASAFVPPAHWASSLKQGGWLPGGIGAISRGPYLCPQALHSPLGLRTKLLGCPKVLSGVDF